MSDELLRDGRYQVVGKLGEGAQGTTFDALDRKTGRAVAIKRFSVRGAKSWKDVELAEREASVLETLSHPALPAHVEHFEESGALYLVMHKIEGQTLLALTGRGGALSRADVVRFLHDAASVLEYLHGRSPPVIHRDINPKNVIRRPDGSYALVDFGAVRDRLKPDGGSTVVGTFGYMAPEQLQGRALPATDVYSVGATALRLLTGREPETLPHKGLSIDVRTALGSSVDPVLRSVLERMLDPDPDRRAASIAPLLRRLDQSAESKRPESRRYAHFSSTEDLVDETLRRTAAEVRERLFSQLGDKTREHHASERAAPPPWEASRSSRDERRRARTDYRSSREERRREARRAEKEHRRARRRGRPLRGPPLAAAVIGLNVAILVVGLMLGVVVPTILLLLSVVLGRPLRDAARATRHAGQDARTAMQHALGYLLEGPRKPAEPEVRVSASGARRHRYDGRVVRRRRSTA